MHIALATSEFVTEHSYTGGLANYTYRVALVLRNLGHAVTVITASGHNASSTLHGISVNQVKIKDENGWKMPRYLQEMNEASKYNYTMMLRIAWQSLRINTVINEIHAHTPFDVIQYSQLEGLGFFRPKKIPCIVRLSSSTRLCHEFGGYGIQKKSLEQQEYLEDIAIKKADAVFGPSAQIAEYVSAKAGRDISVIESPYISDVDQLDTSVYDTLCSQKKYLLFFGSIGHIKGVGTIASIIYPLLTQYPDIYFVFVGKRLHGQEGGDLMEQVWRNAAEHKHRVIWHDSVRHPQLYPIIEHAHAVVLPSRIDNFPNACIEAMAHKKVVIGTKGNGFEQLIDHGKSGLLCSPNNPAELLSTIEIALLLNDQERHAMGQLAAKRIVDLAPEKIGAQLIQFYKNART